MDATSFLLHCRPLANLNHWVRRCKCAHSIVLLSLVLSWNHSAFGEESELAEQKLIFEYSCEQSTTTDILVKFSDSLSGRPSVISEYQNDGQAKKDHERISLNTAANELTLHGLNGTSKGRFSVSGWIDPTSEISLHRRVANETNRWILISEFSLSDLEDQRQVSFVDQNETGSHGWVIRRIEPPPIELLDWPAFATFNPGQSISSTVLLLKNADSNRHPKIELEIRKVGEKQPVHREVYIANEKPSTRVTIDFTAPLSSGVYEARLAVLDQTNNLWSKITGKPDSVFELHRTFAVAGLNTRPNLSQHKWKEIQHIQPSQQAWYMPDWLMNPAAHLPISLPSDRKIPNQIAISKYEGESVTELAPLSSFEIPLGYEDGSVQLHTIRLPSTNHSIFEVEITKAGEGLSRIFTISPNPNATLQGDWQSIQWIHHPSRDERLRIKNLDQSRKFAFESITIETKQGDLDLKRDQNSATRSTVLRLCSSSWIDELSMHDHDQLDQGDWKRESLEMYRLNSAVSRLIAIAHDQGFNTISITLNNEELKPNLSGNKADLRQPNWNRQRYLEFILSTLDQSNLEVILEFNPSIDFNLNNLLPNPESSSEATSTGATESNSSDNKLINESISVPTLNDFYHADTIKRIKANFQQVIDIAQNHQSVVGLSMIALGEKNAMHQPVSPQNLRRLRAIFAAKSEISTPQDTETKASGSDFETWLKKQRRQLWLDLFIPPNDMELFVIGEDSSFGTTAKSPLTFLETYEYGPLKSLSQQLQLSRNLRTRTSQQAVLLSRGQELSEEPEKSAVVAADIREVIESKNPQWMFIDHDLAKGFFSASLIRKLHVFSSLPNRDLAECDAVDPESATVRVWSYFEDDHLHVFLVNLVPWATEVDLETIEPLTWKKAINDLLPEAGHSISSLRPTRSRVTVPADGCILLKSTNTGLNGIRQWTSRVSGGPPIVKRIKTQVTDVVENIGSLTTPTPNADLLINGSFEVSGEMGIIGWMHAQHPAGCVQRDSDVARHGASSARLTTEINHTGRTWIMSDAFSPPASGRVAVALSLRGLPFAESNPSQQVRVTIETTGGTKPLRVFEDLEIPANKEWSTHEVVLEIDNCDPQNLGSLRVAIDSLKPGIVWVDDVEIYDDFPTRSERAEMQRRVFLAVQGMQRGNLLPAGRLLENFWVQRLLTDKRMKRDKKEPAALNQTSENPSVTERFKDWLPGNIRY